MQKQQLKENLSRYISYPHSMQCGKELLIGLTEFVLENFNPNPLNISQEALKIAQVTKEEENEPFMPVDAFCLQTKLIKENALKEYLNRKPGFLVRCATYTPSAIGNRKFDYKVKYKATLRYLSELEGFRNKELAKDLLEKEEKKNSFAFDKQYFNYVC